MASYKSAIRSTPTNGQSEPKLKDKTQQLKEFFPSWSYDDLQSLLAEVNGDVEVAATRISDGKAEQWGSVSRKKDKKAGHTPKDSFPSASPSRGDSRGGRGGARGGRGGPARGGAMRARGDFRGGRGGHANGHVSRTSSPAVGQHVDNKAGDAHKSSIDAANEVTSSISPTPASWADVPKPEEPSTSSAWGGSSAWSNVDSATDNNHHVNLNGSSSGATNQNQAPPLSTKQISKIPATSKLSWAQIARPQEKPAPSPAPVVQHPPPQPPATAIHTAIPHESTAAHGVSSTSASAPPPPEPESINNSGWEDPTTVQDPSFEEEPSVAIPALDPVTESEQGPEPETVPAPKETTSKPIELVVEQAVAPSTPAPPTPAPSTPSKVAARPAPISQRNSARYSNYAKIASDQGGVVMPPTPSSISATLSGISTFGSFGELKSAGVEKVGMQFGSLSLGGTSEPEPEPEPEPAPVVPAEVTTTSSTLASTSIAEPISIAPPPPSSSLNSGLYQTQSQPIQTSVSQPAVSATPSNVSNSPAQSLQQAAPSAQPPSLSQLPQQLQQQAAQAQSQALPSHHYAQLGLSTHIDQSTQAQVQAQSPPQHVQQAQSYLRQNDQSPYGSSVSTGVSSGFHNPPTPPSQDNGYGAFGSVLSSQSLGGQGLGMTGQGLSGMGQGTLGGMGSLGGMSGLGGQGLGHQQQQSLSAFDNYGYEGGQRNFYDSYQPNAFGRGVLGHDDLKGSLPSQQQAQQAPSTTSTGTSTSLPPSASSQSSVPQSQQSPVTSVSSAQGQPQPGQGPAPAGYHPTGPVPFYYQPFPQNSYYGAAAMGAPSNYGYGVGGMGVGVPQPYPGMNVGKYPTMYPGPASAPSPAGKPSPGMGVHGHGGVIGHGGLGVQPQSYGGGLYGQQQGYDDYQHHTQQQHHQQQGHQHHSSHGLGLGQDYSKQLYAGQGGLQGYMSGAGGAGSAVSGSGAGPRGGASPETAYKPYAPKDVGVGRGNVQQSQAQGQGQSQGQTQGQGGQGGGPQGQGFYGGNRFGSASSVGGVGAPQQSAHGAPLYPQGQSDAGYYYQQRQQYWQ
ncbi:hypothetical protein F5050DRAFT_1446437 [Lentinula boryana]|uniref:RNA polymerase II degradation factor 1 n=1 Tax=Lentinula boryana TaxID=40481 RepID=A0ABQ8QFK5_9AGAR|nr:hypothetical protein F5050DRAFT_1446437 [Lentinula boryana]